MLCMVKRETSFDNFFEVRSNPPNLIAPTTVFCLTICNPASRGSSIHFHTFDIMHLVYNCCCVNYFLWKACENNSNISFLCGKCCSIVNSWRRQMKNSSFTVCSLIFQISNHNLFLSFLSRNSIIALIYYRISHTMLFFLPVIQV